MQQADFDHTLFEDGNNSGDAALLVKFFTKTVPDKEATAAQSRAIFKELEYVDIRVAGSRTSNVCRPARPNDISRFPKHYEAFKQRKEAPIEGTPLTEWAVISRSQAEELSFLNVKTVEQLAAMSDNHASQRMGGYDLKAKATKWLEVARAGNSPIQLAEKLEVAENRAIEAESKLNALESTVQQLNARLNAVEVNKQPLEPVANANEPKTNRNRAIKKD
jgi:hypothetical protein